MRSDVSEFVRHARLTRVLRGLLPQSGIYGDRARATRSPAREHELSGRECPKLDSRIILYAPRLLRALHVRIEHAAGLECRDTEIPE
jgi:hypothetical protein